MHARSDDPDRSPTPTELAPGVWRWTAPHPGWRVEDVPWTHEVASLALASPAGLVLVDPLLPADPEASAAVLDRLDRLAAAAEVAILVTIPYHVRSSEALAERYGVRVHGHPACAKRLRDPELLADVTAPDAALPAGVRVFRVGSPVRHETPLFLASHRALAFGDLVVGAAGGLRVWTWDSLDDPRRERWYHERFLPTLRPLLDVDAELVLVTHGPPVMRDGRRRLEEALASPPWHYR